MGNTCQDRDNHRIYQFLKRYSQKDLAQATTLPQQTRARFSCSAGFYHSSRSPTYCPSQETKQESLSTYPGTLHTGHAFLKEHSIAIQDTQEATPTTISRRKQRTPISCKVRLSENCHQSQQAGGQRRQGPRRDFSHGLGTFAPSRCYS